jgi:predicted HD superfamily hydrolase involved in NAD metabolism
MRDRVLGWLEENVPPDRIQHILGVEQMSLDLARHYQLDEVKAALAGLLHDLAKYFRPQKLLQMAAVEGIEIDEVFAANPHLLHADVSAIVAKDEFGVSDREILDAIRNHTLGRPKMNELSCVVFLSDSLEPGRGDKPELNELRKVSAENLYKGVWLTSDYSLKHLLQKRRLIHPRTIATRNWAMSIATVGQKGAKKDRSDRMSASDLLT